MDPYYGSLRDLSKAAKKWVNAEIALYQGSHIYSPRISNDKGNSVPLSHLETAANEFARRFPITTMEEEAKAQAALEMHSPFLLVATNVKDTWFVPDQFHNDHFVRFLLVPGDTMDTSTLFINTMAGPFHTALQKLIATDVDDWRRDNALREFVSGRTSGGKGFEPDEAFGPYLPDWCDPKGDSDGRLEGAPYSRLLIEAEYSHRTAIQLRKQGFKSLNQDHHTRLFLVVKIWKPNKNGDFAAAAVLWGKDNDEEICFRRAVDFGTTALESQNKAVFEVEGVNMLPPVAEWTRLEPDLRYGTLRTQLESSSWSQMEDLLNDNWCMTLSAKDILFKTSTDQSVDGKPYVLDQLGRSGESFPDCHMNLLSST